MVGNSQSGSFIETGQTDNSKSRALVTTEQAKSDSWVETGQTDSSGLNSLNGRGQGMGCNYSF